jgi:hypothetical protein
LDIEEIKWATVNDFDEFPAIVGKVSERQLALFNIIDLPLLKEKTSTDANHKPPMTAILRRFFQRFVIKRLRAAL